MAIAAQQTPQSSAPLPPSEVFTAWLSWWLQAQYIATGEWPMPPDSDSPSTNGNTVHQQHLTPSGSNTPPANVRSGRPEVKTGWPEAGGLVGYESYQQPPMEGLSGPIALPPAAEEEKLPKTLSRTGFDYLESEYGTMAGELLAKTAIKGLALVNCQKVMALVLAWCCFSVFRLEKRGRAGRWMTLGLDRISRELRLTNKTTIETLKLLQTAGLVIVTRAGLSLGQGDKAQVLISEEEIGWLREDFARLAEEEGGGPHGYLNPRFLQANSIKSYPSRKGLQLFGGNSFYFLKEDVSTVPLSPFNPFASLKKEVQTRVGQEKRTSSSSPILEKDVKRPASRTQKDVVKGLPNLKKHGKGPSITEKRTSQPQKGQNRTSPTEKNVLQRPHDMNHDLNDMNDSYPTPAEKKKFKPYRELTDEQKTAIALLKNAHQDFPVLAGANITFFNPQVAWKVAQEYPLARVDWAIQKALYDWVSWTNVPVIQKSKDRPRSSAALIMHNLKTGKEVEGELTAANLADMDRLAANYRKQRPRRTPDSSADEGVTTTGKKGSTSHDDGTARSFGPGSRGSVEGPGSTAKTKGSGVGQRETLAGGKSGSGSGDEQTNPFTDPALNGDGINGFKSLPDRRSRAELEAI